MEPSNNHTPPSAGGFAQQIALLPFAPITALGTGHPRDPATLEQLCMALPVRQGCSLHPADAARVVLRWGLLQTWRQAS